VMGRGDKRKALFYRGCDYFMVVGCYIIYLLPSQFIRLLIIVRCSICILTGMEVRMGLRYDQTSAELVNKIARICTVYTAAAVIE
jgi:hypothetical protein